MAQSLFGILSIPGFPDDIWSWVCLDRLVPHMCGWLIECVCVLVEGWEGGGVHVRAVVVGRRRAPW